MNPTKTPIDYTSKSYGRNKELAEIFQLLKSGRDISMPGPRRLGKSFVLRQIFKLGESNNFKVIFPKEVGGIASVADFYKHINKAIEEKKPSTIVKDGFNSIVAKLFRRDQEQIKNTKLLGVLAHDPQEHFETLIQQINADTTPWVILIDEFPIFLNNLHRAGQIEQARLLMNNINSLKAANPNVRFVITGSIGIDPLAKEGNYQGALVKYEHYQLHPLSKQQAMDYLMDVEKEESYPNRNQFNQFEAEILTTETGWLTVYYLEALAKKMPVKMADSKEEAQQAVDFAIKTLLNVTDSQTFSVWEENLRKHYLGNDQALAIKTLQTIVKSEQVTNTHTLMTMIADPSLDEAKLRQILRRLESEGYVSCHDWDAEVPAFAIRNALLKRWWKRYPLTLTV